MQELHETVFSVANNSLFFLIRIVRVESNWASRHVGHQFAYCTSPRWLWGWRIWWNDDWQVKPKYSEKTWPQWRFVHHKSHMTWPENICFSSALVWGEWSASRPCRFTPGTHWTGGRLGPRAELDDVEKRKFLALPEFELRPLCRSPRSQSLYRLRYPGSQVASKTANNYQGRNY
jgi:hypothetical protein